MKMSGRDKKIFFRSAYITALVLFCLLMLIGGSYFAWREIRIIGFGDTDTGFKRFIMELLI